MKRFQNLPIQRKMLVMTMLICGAVLMVAIAAFFAFQVVNFRTNLERDTATLATIIANQSTAAVEFSDDVNAKEILSSLKAKSTVLSASLELTNGTVLAYYGFEEHKDVLDRKSTRLNSSHLGI